MHRRHYAGIGTSCGSVSACPICFCHKSFSVEIGEYIELVLAWRLLSTYLLLYYKEIKVSTKNKGPSFWNFVIITGHIDDKSIG